MAAPRAARRRRRHARPGRDRSSRPTAGSRAAGSRCSARRLHELGKQRATRRKARRRSQTPTIALAGYTNVGKSTLLNALTGADVVGRRPAVRDARPDDARASSYDGRRYLVTDTVGFIRRLPHQLVEGFAATLEETLVADLVLHVVDASADRRAAGRAWSPPSSPCSAEIGADELPVELVLNKIDAVDPLRRRRLGEPLSRTRCRSRRGRARGSTSCARAIAERFARTVRGRPAARSRTTRAASSPSCTRSARRSTSAIDREEGVFVRARLPDARRCAASRRSSSSSRTRRRTRRAGDRAADPAPARGRGPARARLRGRRRARPRRVRARELGPGERAVVGTGLAVAIPEGYAGLRPAALGAGSRPRDHGREHAGPDRLRLPRRAARDPAATPTPREPFVVEPGMRIAQLVVVAGRAGRAGRGRRAAGDRARRARLRILGGRPDGHRAADPRLGASCAGAGGSCSAATRRTGGSTGCFPGGGVELGREPRATRCTASCAEEVGIDDEIPVEGPVAIVDSIAPGAQLRGEARRPHHLRRRPRADGRSRP